MSKDQEIANALSDGINCLAVIAAQDVVDPSWSDTLGAMELALEAIANKDVMTSMTVSEAEFEGVRRLRSLLADWSRTGQRPESLPALAEELLRSFMERSA